MYVNEQTEDSARDPELQRCLAALEVLANLEINGHGSFGH